MPSRRRRFPSPRRPGRLRHRRQSWAGVARRGRSASTPAPAPIAWPRSTTPPIAGSAIPSPTAPTAGPATRSSLAVPYDRPATTMAGVRHVRRVPARVRRPRRPPLPRPAQRLSRLRPPSCATAIPAAGLWPTGRPRSTRPWPPSSRGPSSPSRGSAASTSPSTPPTPPPSPAATAQGPGRQAVRGHGRRIWPWPAGSSPSTP